MNNPEQNIPDNQSGIVKALGAIKIVDFDPHWSQLFSAERAKLFSLPNEHFLEIEHFGSTAIPGLNAKPIIDIMAAVNTLDEVGIAKDNLRSLGYEIIDVGFKKRIFLRKAPDQNGVSYHLHIIPIGAWVNKSERLFRDYLINHPDTAAKYAELKNGLAKKFPDNSPAYTAAKSEFIQKIVNTARGELNLPKITDWEE